MMEKTASETAQDETPKERAKTLLRDGATIDDVVARSGLNRNTVLGLYSALVRANKSLKVANKRTEAETEQEIDFQAQKEADQLEEAAGGLHVPPVPSSPNYVLRPGATAEEFQKYMKMKKEDLIADNVNLRAQVASLQGVAQTGRGDGDERPLSRYDEELKRLEVERQKIQNEQEREYALFQREERLRARMGVKGGSLQDAVKQTLEAIKVGVDLVPKGANVDPLGVYRSGRADEAKTFENAVKSSETNMMDLKLEEMKQNERLKIEELHWEKEQYADKKAGEAKTQDLILKVVEGPVGQLLGALGAKGKEKLIGTAKPMQTSCPACGKPIWIDSNANQVICGQCGAILQKPSAPPAQPETPQQPSEQPTEEEAESKAPKQGFQEGEF
jgi:ribosomal protein S27E